MRLSSKIRVRSAASCRSSTESSIASSAVVDAVEDRKVAVHDGIGDEIEEKVGAAPGEAGVAGSALPDRLERGDFGGVHRDEVVFAAEEEVNFLRLGVAGPLVRASEGMEHHEEIVVEFFDFGPLIEMETVLERERVKPKALAQDGHLGFALLLDVDPAQLARRRRRHVGGRRGHGRCPAGLEVENPDDGGHAAHGISIAGRSLPT